MGKIFKAASAYECWPKPTRTLVAGTAREGACFACSKSPVTEHFKSFLTDFFKKYGPAKAGADRFLPLRRALSLEQRL